MQDDILDFRALIALWPSMREFARQVGGEAAAEYGRIWHRRNRVPRQWWPAVLEAAARLGRPIDTEFLERLYEAGRGDGR